MTSEGSDHASYMVTFDADLYASHQDCRHRMENFFIYFQTFSWLLHEPHAAELATEECPFEWSGITVDYKLHRNSKCTPTSTTTALL